MKNRFLVLSLIISILTLTNCSSSKEPINFENVKIENELHKATKISVNDFFQIWMSNKANAKLDENVYELFKDENFTYFGKNEFKSLTIKRKLYKVENRELQLHFKNYKNVDGEVLRQEFWNKIVSETDKQIYTNSNCSSSSSNPKYSYELIDNEIHVRIVWKFRCNGKKLIDKSYTSNFDLDKREFMK